MFEARANASQCHSIPLEENIKNADVIFLGEVIERSPFNEEGRGWEYSAERPDCGSKIAKLKISKAWKGDFLNSETTVYSYDGCYMVGSYLGLNRSFIVFANKTPDDAAYESQYSIGTVCEGTSEYSTGEDKDYPYERGTELKQLIEEYFNKKI